MPMDIPFFLLRKGNMHCSSLLSVRHGPVYAYHVCGHNNPPTWGFFTRKMDTVFVLSLYYNTDIENNVQKDEVTYLKKQKWKSIPEMVLLSPSYLVDTPKTTDYHFYWYKYKHILCMLVIYNHMFLRTFF